MKKMIEEYLDEVKNNKQIIQEWMVAENNRMREENVLRTAREDGLKEGIKKGIKQGIQYNVPIGVDTLRRREPINCTQVEGIKSLKVDTNLWVL